MTISVSAQWVDAGRVRSYSDMGDIWPSLLSLRFIDCLGSNPASKYSKGFLELPLAWNWTNGQLKDMDSSLSGLVR